MSELYRYLLGVLTREVRTNEEYILNFDQRLEYFNLIAEYLQQYHGINAAFTYKRGEWFICAAQGAETVCLRYTAAPNYWERVYIDLISRELKRIPLYHHRYI